MRLSRQEYWSGLSCPPLGDFPHPGIESPLLCLLHWQVGSLPLALPGKPFLSHKLLFQTVQLGKNRNIRIHIQHSMYPLGEPCLSWDENRVAFSSSCGHILVAAWLISCIMVRISPVGLFATPHGLSSLSMGPSRQEYWNGLPFLTPRDLPNPGVEPESPVFPALAIRFFTAEPLGSPLLGSPRNIILGAFLVLN